MVSKDAGRHPNWNLAHVLHPAQTCLLQPNSTTCVLPVLHVLRPLPESPYSNSPSQLLSTNAPNPVNHFPLNLECKKSERGIYAVLWEDVWAMPAADFWAHLQMWDPQRRFLRDLNKGEMWSVNKRGTPVLDPCIHKGKSSGLLYPYIFTATFLLNQEHSMELPIMPWWGHWGELVCQHWL